jgi:hypothetical protein
MYFGYKWWSCIRSEPVDEQNWVHLSSCLPNSSGDLRSPYELVVRRLSALLPDLTEKKCYKYHELYCSASDFDENIHLVQYWNNHLKKNNNMHCEINCPLLMIKLDDKYLIHLYTNPSKKFAYLSDITQLIHFDKGASHPEELGKGVDSQDISPLPNSSGDRRSPPELVVVGILPTDPIWIHSKVKFLNISYTHPNMPNEIILEIPHNMFFVGNHILSAAFVLRMLEYTVGSSVVFDMNYKLKIIDSNITYFEMDSHEYLELERDTYNLKQNE